MNLLEQYKQLQKTNLSKDGDMQLGIAYKKENGLTTVKYLHGGVDFNNPLYRQARGLTLDLRGNVIVRSFEKFFNWKQLTEYENYSKEFKKEYFLKLKEILEEEYKNYTVYPPKKDILNAFLLTPYSEVKVVLLGQDPYHQRGQAHGLAFSVNYGIKTPPSLVNMYKELQDDLGLYIPNNGFLEKWAKQGVLLLNTTLTVRDSEANSHSKIGWQTFTDNIIKKLNEREKPVIFILWGNNAKAKEKFIDTNKHYILKGVHPSPLSANKGFFGCKHFSEVNRILKDLNQKEIDWQIENKEI